MTGFALVCGYGLLGATWVVMKTESTTQEWARKCANYLLVYVAFFMALVSLIMPFINADIKTLWFTSPTFFMLLPVPLLTIAMFVTIWRDLHKKREYRPFFLSVGIFLMGYIGLAVSLWPYVVPFEITIWQAAAAPESQSLLLVGTILLLPVVLGYVGYSYYLFRGKASHETIY